MVLRWVLLSDGGLLGFSLARWVLGFVCFGGFGYVSVGYWLCSW